ncbi:MAG: ABC transporter substrate-binding protein [Christensenellaceae bacterium]|jgi:iron complex transport system substrate-binding protein|nr:ABC transporter substrate-binding protein [Christensenellaceae bacterium]
MKRKYLFITMALIAMLVIGIMALSSCNKDESENTTGTEDTRPEVKIVDADGVEHTLKTNPKNVAIYDYGVLDILDSVGFATSGIEKLVVPNKDGLPADLASYKTMENVYSGGSLFYVDFDVLDLIQPELVILGGRSFGMDVDGNRLGTEDAAAFKKSAYDRYPNTKFIKISVNSSNSNLVNDMERNAYILARIFKNVEIAIKFQEIKSNIAEIQAKAIASKKTALFVMMVDQTTMSVFNVNSRFDMLYEDFGFLPIDPNTVQWTDAHGLTARAEYVLEQNPDLIFVLDRSATIGSGAGYENFIGDTVIKQTKAFKNNNIYLLTGESWYTMTGGFTAADRMIANINQYFDSIEE